MSAPQVPIGTIASGVRLIDRPAQRQALSDMLDMASWHMTLAVAMISALGLTAIGIELAVH